MAEDTKKKRFWASLPGILTGVAAVITAVTGMYIAIDRSRERPSSVQPVSQSSAVKSILSPNEWPLIADETFTVDSSGWITGSHPGKGLARFDLNIVGGKYRWDMEFVEVRERWVDAPYGPATDFYLAIDVKFVAFSDNGITASLFFGKASRTDYSFHISPNKVFGLGRSDATKGEMVIDWTPVPINPNESNRMAVIVEDGEIRLYINSELLGTYEDSKFTGGKVGLSVSSYQAGTSTVVDFDNFEFRRKMENL